MAKISSLVIGYFFAVLVVLQSGYVKLTEFPIYLDLLIQVFEISFLFGQCNTGGAQIYFGYVESCYSCDSECGSQSSDTICIHAFTDTGAYKYACNCFLRKGHYFWSYTGAAATTTTSLTFLSFSLLLSFVLNMLFF
ncbi:hypothetical protein MKX03_017697 [Papaver bracteatum]|nr:hypothetical protein MKX03_017697 [Papaver bracteatum]